MVVITILMVTTSYYLPPVKCQVIQYYKTYVLPQYMTGSAIGSLLQHSRTPVISSDRANIVQDTGAGTFPTLELQKVHGMANSN